MAIKELQAYELLREEGLSDIQSVGYLLRHRKSGARIMVIANDDDNKVFHITFRTPPVDSTGVAHILEHCSLCGSEKFPSKDPFVELVKGSLNTFLNAMTYPDKTMYPIASCNDKDFANLMDVYMDAVFHTNIYKKEEIFRQEGWNYHLENPEDEITYNGVVYNEMKGAYSSPEDVLDREILNALYPDTPYGFESGGDPQYLWHCERLHSGGGSEGRETDVVSCRFVRKTSGLWRNRCIVREAVCCQSFVLSWKRLH